MDHPIWALKSVVDQAVATPVKYTLFLADYWLRIFYEVGLAAAGFVAAILCYFVLLDLLTRVF